MRAFVHMPDFTSALLFGIILKAVARSEQVMPFAVLISATLTQINFALSGQFLAMKLFCYKYFTTVFPAIVMLIFFAVSTNLGINFYKSDLMLSANSFFCQANVKQYCHTKTNLWGYAPGLVVHFDQVVGNKAEGTIIRLDHMQTILSVKMRAKFLYKYKHWWYENNIIPVKLAPSEIKYSVLTSSDQPTDLSISIQLIAALLYSIFISMISWNYLAEGRKLSNINKYPRNGGV